MENKVILVIEDNELNMKLVRSLLQIGGYAILESIDAETGIQIEHQHLPDLILMDIQLPGMDGLQAIQKIKNDLCLQQIPIVAITSYAMRGDEEKTKEAGYIGYIAKPIDTRNFLKTISSYFTDNASK